MEEMTNSQDVQHATLLQTAEWQEERLPAAFNAFTPVPIQANIDGVDIRFLSAKTYV